MATTLSDQVTYRTVRLIEDEGPMIQTLAVNSDLEAIETPQGHGDSL